MWKETAALCVHLEWLGQNLGEGGAGAAHPAMAVLQVSVQRERKCCITLADGRLTDWRTGWLADWLADKLTI